MAGPTTFVTTAYRARGVTGRIFFLCQKSGVGTVHLPHGLQSTVSYSLKVYIASQQDPETSSVKKFQRFEDPFEHSPLESDQIRLLIFVARRG
jgi:hypothetical protein